MYNGPLSEAQLEMLERLVDASNVAEVIDALANVCDYKAEQILNNWQDEHLAKSWQRVALRLYSLSLSMRQHSAYGNVPGIGR